MSSATKDHIRRSLVYIVIQLSVMFLFLMIPMIIFIYQMLAISYNHILTFGGLLMLSFHASAGTLTGICLNKKYRLLIKKKILCCSNSSKVWFQRTTGSRSGGQ